MPTKQGQMNRDINGSLAVGTNDTLYIELPGAPDQVIEIYHIDWGYSFLTTPIPAGDFTYGSLKVIRNQIFSTTQNYTDAFGSTAALFEMYYQDVINGAVGVMPQHKNIPFDDPIRTTPGEGILIVVGAPLSGFAGSFGAHLFVKGNYAKVEMSANFPYLLR